MAPAAILPGRVERLWQILARQRHQLRLRPGGADVEQALEPAAGVGVDFGVHYPMRSCTAKDAKHRPRWAGGSSARWVRDLQAPPDSPCQMVYSLAVTRCCLHRTGMRVTPQGVAGTSRAWGSSRSRCAGQMACVGFGNSRPKLSFAVTWPGKTKTQESWARKRPWPRSRLGGPERGPQGKGEPWP